MANTDPITEASTTILGKIGASAQVAGTTVVVGASTKQYWGFSLDEWSLIGIFTGIILGGIGFVTSSGITLYYKRKEDRRQEAEYQARMRIGAILRDGQEQLMRHGGQR